MRNALPILILLLISMIVCCKNKDMDNTQALKRAKEQHAATIIALPDVVSIGIGKASAGDPAIIIGLEKSNPKTEARIHKLLKAFPVEVRLTGKAKALE
jgi:CO dehydrogenase/acetyl-CoA synthase epsilon subunit